MAGNYSLGPLVGMEMRHKKVGVIGTGAIGAEAARLFKVIHQLQSSFLQVQDLLSLSIGGVSADCSVRGSTRILGGAELVFLVTIMS